MTADTYNPPESLSGFQSKAMIAAAVGAVLAVVGFMMSGLDRFYEAYLVAWVYWTGVGLGSLALLMLQHLSGGAWGVVIRRILEAAARTLPVMAILGVPILLGMGHLYHWTDADVAAADPMIRDKAAYLNVPFFIVRYVLYFAIWSFMALRLSAWSAEQDRTGDPALAGKMGAPLGRRAAGVRPDRDLRGGRLDDVGQPALVLDDVGAALRRRPGPVGAGLRHRRAGDAVQAGAARPGRQPVAPARPGQAALRLHHAVGLPVVLAVHHHLLGEHAGRDPALLGARPERLAVGRLGAGRLPLRAALRAAAVARHQARLAAG